MSGSRPDDLSWSSQGLWLFGLLVLAAQVGLIFWLGERRPISPRPPAPTASLRWAGEDYELLALRDPTLFALPHQQSFAGMAWLKAFTPPLPAVYSNEPPHWLDLNPEQLGASFRLLLEPKSIPAFRVPQLPQPDLRLPDAPATAPGVRSVLRIEADVPVPRLLSAIALPSWPPRSVSPTDTELLTNTVVQVMINPHGKPMSAVLLGGSGFRPADDYAMRQTWDARFAPLDDAPEETEESAPSLDRLRWCRLVFKWHTLPATNAVSSTP